MPPARSRNNQDDSRSDASAHAAGNGRGSSKAQPNVIDKRRPANNVPPPTLEKQTSSGAVNANGSHAHEGIEGMGWDDIPLSVLHNYRQAYRLPVPSASSSYRNIVLSGGIGKKTPSRVRARISRDALATAVRKNFNAQPIQENEVIVNFLYTVKNQDKKFRLSFPPPLGNGVLLNSPGDTRTPTSHVIHRLELHSAPRISSVWLTVHSAALLLSFDSTLQAHSDQVWLSVGIAFFGFYLAYLAVPYAALP